MNQAPDLWNQRYATDEFVFGTEPNDFLRHHVGALRAGNVCCIGDGEGRNGVFLAAAGFDVTSVDLSQVGMAKAAALAASAGVPLSTITADLSEWVHTPEGRGPWDNVVSIFCHMPSPVRAAVFPRLIDALAPGGVLLLESYTPEQIARGTGGPPDPDLLLSADRARVELAGLDLELLEETERDVTEGSLHTGIASVLQCIGRKP